MAWHFFAYILPTQKLFVCALLSHRALVESGIGFGNIRQASGFRLVGLAAPLPVSSPLIVAMARHIPWLCVHTARSRAR